MINIYEIKADTENFASVLPYIQGLKVTELEPAALGDWSRSFLVFDRMTPMWENVRSYVDEPGLPLSDYFNIGASSSVFGTFMEELQQIEELYRLMTDFGELLPFEIEDKGKGLIFHCINKIEETLDLQKSRGRKMSNGCYMATKPVFKNDIINEESFFRIPEAPTKLFLSYEGDVSELFGVDNNGLVIAEG